jgi:hypothetical protein
MTVFIRDKKAPEFATNPLEHVQARPHFVITPDVCSPFFRIACDGDTSPSLNQPLDPNDGFYSDKEDAGLDEVLLIKKRRPLSSGLQTLT